jgi:hypothetical protein
MPDTLYWNQRSVVVRVYCQFYSIMCLSFQAIAIGILTRMASSIIALWVPPIELGEDHSLGYGIL